MNLVNKIQLWIHKWYFISYTMIHSFVEFLLLKKLLIPPLPIFRTMKHACILILRHDSLPRNQNLLKELFFRLIYLFCHMRNTHAIFHNHLLNIVFYHILFCKWGGIYMKLIHKRQNRKSISKKESALSAMECKKQGWMHGNRSRMWVGRGHIWGH